LFSHQQAQLSTVFARGLIRTHLEQLRFPWESSLNRRQLTGLNLSSE
jgi:hypothetical protein